MNDKEKLEAIYEIIASHAWDKIHDARHIGGTNELSIALEDLITSWEENRRGFRVRQATDDELDELDAEIIQGILQLVDIELSERHKEMTQKEIKLIHNIRKMAGYED